MEEEAAIRPRPPELPAVPLQSFATTKPWRCDQHEASRSAATGKIVARGMGAFAAVAQGTDEEPRLIVLRYRPKGAAGPHLAYVGKAVTFDTGGISIKPSAKMQEMKMDMSGGAAVLQAMDAIARLGVPVTLTASCGDRERTAGTHPPG